MHPGIEAISAALLTLGQQDNVELSGAWSSRRRRTYASAAQLGSGEGPFVEVVDHLWDAFIQSPNPVNGLAFLVTSRELSWVKSHPRQIPMRLTVSLTALVGDPDHQATFTCGLGGSLLPSVPVPFDGDPAGWAPKSARFSTGTAQEIARMDGATFVIILVRSDLCEVARNRLWRLRERHASILAAPVKAILTRGRSGSESA